MEDIGLLRHDGIGIGLGRGTRLPQGARHFSLYRAYMYLYNMAAIVFQQQQQQHYETATRTVTF